MQAELVAAEAMKAGQRLTREGKRVARNAITDGLFTETKEMIAGYWFILAGSLAEAAATASGNPCLAFGLSYDVRPIESVRANAFALTNETPAARNPLR